MAFVLSEAEKVRVDIEFDTQYRRYYDRLQSQDPTLAELLNNHGYATA